MTLSNKYPSNWDSLRREVYRRDGWSCQRCGKSGTKLHAHHKIRLSKGGSNDISNIESICRRCHEKEHPHLFWGRIWFWTKMSFGGFVLLLLVLMFIFH